MREAPLRPAENHKKGLLEKRRHYKKHGDLKVIKIRVLHASLLYFYVDYQKRDNTFYHA